MNNKQDIRFQQLQQWLQGFITDKNYSLAPASSDASFRRYFRLQQMDSSFIVMDSPPEHEDNQSFIKVATVLEQFGLNVPHIYQQDLQQGFLILSDLGNTPYLSQLSVETADELYKKAIDSLISLQQIPCENQSLPQYEASLLQREMQLFNDWFLQRHLGLNPPEWLAATFDFLTLIALEQPQVIVHRDFHSRNLMYLQGQKPGIIDFQDAVVGAISYDLVSLLRDVYIQWSPAEQQQWVGYYIEQAQQHELLTFEQAQNFPRWFDLMGLQRHLKILGIFCRLNYRDNKPNYMNDLALTLNYVYQVCERYPELQNLYQYLIEQPKIAAIK
ncbi:phosphotransferase [uncultured Methylophaga sp.]|uniref:aminoglycoside phosphotransferase family protein n=1 Tax=uncultured Methylophaga sp. TaxID=285271 RepID=UPI0030D83C54|tara:strand:+ start:6845 stop:7834 length:990 start_codon:yes stop_codon:yes gene_type:complete